MFVRSCLLTLVILACGSLSGCQKGWYTHVVNGTSETITISFFRSHEKSDIVVRPSEVIKDLGNLLVYSKNGTDFVIANGKCRYRYEAFKIPNRPFNKVFADAYQRSNGKTLFGVKFLVINLRFGADGKIEASPSDRPGESIGGEFPLLPIKGCEPIERREAR